MESEDHRHRNHLLFDLSVRLRHLGYLANIVWPVGETPFIRVIDLIASQVVRVEARKDNGEWIIHTGRDELKATAPAVEPHKAVSMLVRELSGGHV